MVASLAEAWIEIIIVISWIGWLIIVASLAEAWIEIEVAGGGN